jgi:site-specific recombinase XerD
VLRVAGDGPDGARLRALIMILWRAGLRIGEALAFAETDLDRSRANLGITSIYLQGIDNSEIIATVHSRPAPVISATAGLHAGRWPTTNPN